MKYTFNIVLYQETGEPICSKRGIMLNTTKLSSLIPVWMTLMFTQGHRVTGHLCKHSVVKFHEATQMFMMVDYVRKVTVNDGWLCKEGDCEEVL